MTVLELDEISKEIDDIDHQISILDANNLIENSIIERLFNRWDFLDSKLKKALVETKRKNFRIVN